MSDPVVFDAGPKKRHIIFVTATGDKDVDYFAFNKRFQGLPFKL